MDKKLHIVRLLYGETERSETRDLLGDESLREEYQALSEVKFYLDQRRGARPDAAVLNQVFAAARGEVPVHARRPDRAPVARQAAPRRRLLWVGAALSLVVAAAVVLVAPWSSTEEAAPTLADRAEITLDPAADGISAMPPVPLQVQALARPAARQAPSLVPSLAAGMDTQLTWDSRDDLYRLRRSLETLEAFRMGQQALPAARYLAPQVPAGLLEAGSTVARERY